MDVLKIVRKLKVKVKLIKAGFCWIYSVKCPSVLVNIFFFLVFTASEVIFVRYFEPQTVYHISNTYILSHYQHFSQDYGLTSHITHVEYVNFIRKWQDLQFNVDSEWQIFEKLFTLRIFARYLLRKSQKRYFHIFVLMSDPGCEPEIQNNA